jgi:hypothetical protein
VFIDRENKMTLVIDIAVPLTHYLPKTETEKIMKYENSALEIKKISGSVITHPYTPYSSQWK